MRRCWASLEGVAEMLRLRREFNVCFALFIAGTVCFGQEIGKTTDKQGFIGKDTMSDASSASIGRWESSRDVALSPEARDAAISNLGNLTDSFESHRKSLGFSKSDYKQSVDAVTFEYLDAALRIQRSQGFESNQLDKRFVRKIDPGGVAGFLNDSSGFGLLTLTSVPSNGEILVDGNFKGYTGTTLGLSVGLHEYEIRPPKGSSCRDKIQVDRDRRYTRQCPTASKK